jgi:hypothetical protein
MRRGLSDPLSALVWKRSCVQLKEQCSFSADTHSYAYGFHGDPSVTTVPGYEYLQLL